jgi:hypothetical protein
MGLYGLDAVTILFPGDAGANAVVEGKGFSILELAVSPDAEDLSDAAAAILSTLRVPTF